jgi:hypothetical protein
MWCNITARTLTVFVTECEKNGEIRHLTPANWRLFLRTVQTWALLDCRSVVGHTGTARSLANLIKQSVPTAQKSHCISDCGLLCSGTALLCRYVPKLRENVLPLSSGWMSTMWGCRQILAYCCETKWDCWGLILFERPSGTTAGL